MVKGKEQINDRILVLKELIEGANIIGIDIDGTIADTIRAAIDEVRSKFGNILEFSQWKEWNPHQIPQLQNSGIVTIQDTIDIFYAILQEHGTQIVYPVEGSQEGITKLQSVQKELIALSGRLEESRGYTTGWLEFNFPGVFQKILLTDYDTPRQIPKYELAREHDIDLMIEDNSQYAIDLSTHGIPTILLDAPWNIDIDLSEYSKVFRVKNWTEIIKYL